MSFRDFVKKVVDEVANPKNLDPLGRVEDAVDAFVRGQQPAPGQGVSSYDRRYRPEMPRWNPIAGPPLPPPPPGGVGRYDRAFTPQVIQQVLASLAAPGPAGGYDRAFTPGMPNTRPLPPPRGSTDLGPSTGMGTDQWGSNTAWTQPTSQVDLGGGGQGMPPAMPWPWPSPNDYETLPGTPVEIAFYRGKLHELDALESMLLQSQGERGARWTPTDLRIARQSFAQTDPVRFGDNFWALPLDDQRAAIDHYRQEYLSRIPPDRVA